MQSGMSQRRCNLLLVEDQLDLAALMEQALEDAGDQVTHAYSVFDALGLLDNQRFDGAVLDVELRDGVVFPVADRLTELGIPFLFVSAVYDQLVPQRHRRAAFVAKPFHVGELQETVRRVMGDVWRATAGALIAMGWSPQVRGHHQAQLAQRAATGEPIPVAARHAADLGGVNPQQPH